MGLAFFLFVFVQRNQKSWKVSEKSTKMLTFLGEFLHELFLFKWKTKEKQSNCVNLKTKMLFAQLLICYGPKTKRKKKERDKPKTVTKLDRSWFQKKNKVFFSKIVCSKSIIVSTVFKLPRLFFTVIKLSFST